MKSVIGIVSLALICYAWGFFLGVGVNRNNYKQGQIDALTGNIKYDLVVKSDSTKVWERIENE